MHVYVYIYIYMYYTYMLFICFVVFVDSASLPYKFLTRLPGVCSGGGRGFPPETLNGLSRNPLSCTRQDLNPGPPTY